MVDEMEACETACHTACPSPETWQSEFEKNDFTADLKRRWDNHTLRAE